MGCMNFPEQIPVEDMEMWIKEHQLSGDIRQYKREDEMGMYPSYWVETLRHSLRYTLFPGKDYYLLTGADLYVSA